LNDPKDYEGDCGGQKDREEAHSLFLSGWRYRSRRRPHRLGARRRDLARRHSDNEHARRLEGYSSDVTSHLAYLIAIGFAPVGAMVLLVIVTRLENSLPQDNVLRRS